MVEGDGGGLGGAGDWGCGGRRIGHSGLSYSTGRGWSLKLGAGWERKQRDYRYQIMGNEKGLLGFAARGGREIDETFSLTDSLLPLY